MVDLHAFCTLVRICKFLFRCIFAPFLLLFKCGEKIGWESPEIPRFIRFVWFLFIHFYIKIRYFAND